MLQSAYGAHEMQVLGSDQDLRLAPAHEAILGGPDFSQADTRKLPTDAAFDDADDMYAGLDLAEVPQGTTDSTNGAYKPQQGMSDLQSIYTTQRTPHNTDANLSLPCACSPFQGTGASSDV